MVEVTLYRSPDGTLSLDPRPEAEQAQAILGEGYRIDDGVGTEGEARYVFGGPAELGMTAAQAIARGVLVLVR